MQNQLIKSLVFTLLLLNCGVATAQNISTVFQSQAEISQRFMMVNISPPGTAAGAVVASPSRMNPNYFYDWVRDAALTMDLVDHFYVGSHSPAYRQIMMNYVSFSRKNQTTQTRGGIGEPKFNVDGSAFNFDWGRPQNDGPALRAITLIHFARALLNEGQGPFVRSTLYDGKLPTQSVIKTDLDYVSHHWGDPCFDLWEEVDGHHFYTLMVQRRSMIEGAQLAQVLGDSAAAVAYNQVAVQISNVIKSYWDGNNRILVTTLGRIGGLNYKTSNLDSGVILGVLHGSLNDNFLTPANDMVLSTAFRIQQVFAQTYPINQRGGTVTTGTAIGRYPEDRYNGINSNGGGNPWILSTAAFGELCYRAASEFQKNGVINISVLNKPFLDEAIGNTTLLQPGMSLTPKDSRFAAVLKGLGNLGDSFLKTVIAHRGSDGSFSEEINRDNGFMQGATNLTWSDASFLTAYNARLALMQLAFRAQ